MANTTKAIAEPTIIISDSLLTGDLNNGGIDFNKIAPVKPIPKIKTTKTLFTRSPSPKAQQFDPFTD